MLRSELFVGAIIRGHWGIGSTWQGTVTSLGEGGECKWRCNLLPIEGTKLTTYPGYYCSDAALVSYFTLIGKVKPKKKLKAWEL